jgi:hypothetical protein
MRVLLIVIWAIFILAGADARAEVFTFNPTPHNFTGLTDANFYLWNVNFAPPAGQNIVSATLYIDDIDAITANNDLSVFLGPNVNNPGTDYGLNELKQNKKGSSWTGTETNKIEGSLENNLIGSYHDSNPIIPHHDSPTDLTFNFDSTLLEDLITFDDNGNFSIGFDPEGSFKNKSIELKIHTSKDYAWGPSDPPNAPDPVTPEPSNFLLLSAGLLSFGIFRKVPARF